jgi:hypothetical protein
LELGVPRRNRRENASTKFSQQGLTQGTVVVQYLLVEFWKQPFQTFSCRGRHELICSMTRLTRKSCHDQAWDVFWNLARFYSMTAASTEDARELSVPSLA